MQIMYALPAGVKRTSDLVRLGVITVISNPPRPLIHSVTSALAFATERGRHLCHRSSSYPLQKGI
jgi:hypothetical protein